MEGGQGLTTRWERSYDQTDLRYWARMVHIRKRKTMVIDVTLHMTRVTDSHTFLSPSVRLHCPPLPLLSPPD